MLSYLEKGNKDILKVYLKGIKKQHHPLVKYIFAKIF